MNPESGVIMAVMLGFLLGLRHATDADHVVAVSTIVSQYRNAWRGLWVGMAWGLGHTTPLVVMGFAILVFKDTVLDRYELVAPVFEFGVGAMLVFLGVQVFWNLSRGRLHLHDHTHDYGPHVHIHATHSSRESMLSEKPHGFFHLGRPFFRKKSYLVGFAHGLAGSAAIMLMLLPKLPSLWIGGIYLILFSIGTMVSMAVVTLVLGIPFAITGRFKKLNEVVTSVAGTASVVLGGAIMSDVMIGTQLIPF